MKTLIPVASPLLPPLEEFIPYLEEIWKTKRLTNGGPFHQQLEKELADYLGVKYLSLFANGTLALVTALQALRISGEVITTPYSFVATAHSLLWNGVKPVFVDIDPHTYNLDPDRLEEAITPATTAIMPVHCYGIPCNVERIQEIADRYGLKVIYDAAHAFGVRHNDQSLLCHGDMSILSFHATKVFNTFEGGAIICPDAKTKQRIDYLKNFGFADEVTVVAPGINGKMSEINAAFGLLQLKYIDAALQRRKRVDTIYREAIAAIPGIELAWTVQDGHNYSYFPILVGPGFSLSRDALYERFREQNILVRRYFYPLITEFPMYRGLESARKTNVPFADDISHRILCLPIFDSLTDDEIERVIHLISSAASESL
ncbi:dTDP-4-amino-4,6-dideoxy-D-glucose aminotransferase VioA [Pseudomonas sp. CCI3.2]|uniref:dTDP-4-amino-4,6-dideoxy-D-glucose aminotransferase VioA n=1 Tax=unclassified Pseudomonas TaxID=196821 RepID=UPI002AC8F8BE|nr:MULTISPECIES: dTDP-4-amino-4,6-dideoxy-D-glucose aminotransferase VioA [unclassified Pseudomonas]MEB0078659.1 dTDP-4-amino-4,6-dideoxy-D-glucose aminotransferase VioA [Pseudomonas sp. MH10out]MEB0093955.1 dTDP-4-amino-4,6-dideoxy-D-glucose aminotransferase VioA [Pseudomonas sp. CCI4.2]MEB0103723.1 dTDP-4-amino-4,6-dideoxy-D-glucose aminotransferase VioA [Pseudomonas sp. CCI3.2]MEB0131203.1 dTDP-4-amino-4,6-dideoxy-D-glucose aminotransferase VioA [Pseudomonas sp. CCI2.4]MEB0158128.1 dTDP-4-a